MTIKLKIDELDGILHATDIDIAAITETWMSTTVSLNPAPISASTTSFTGHDVIVGDVALLSTSRTVYGTAPGHLHPDDLECVWLLARPRRLPTEVSSLIVAAVYSVPKAPTEDRLLDILALFITCLRGKYPKCGLLICRDFNKSGVANKITRITTRFSHLPR